MTVASASTGFAPPITTIERAQLRPLLQRVEKPGRYVGGEFGIPPADPQAASVRVALSYADTYELGMSNQGLKILYDRVNSRPDFLADRIYLPWPDFARELRANEIPLYSLDHFLAASSFDVWGFNTATELQYTNLVYALDMAGIPVLRKDRRPNDPIIITGGTAVSNPLPIFDFMDGIFMGDGEEGLIEICELIAEKKAAGASREEIVHAMKGIEGIVLPHLYEVEESGPTLYPIYHGPRVTKRTYRGDAYADLNHMIVPSIEIVQDRVVVEVARGCSQGCRFCHAGFWKRPVRNTEVDTLIKNAGAMLKKTGSDSVSLHSLSIADYPWLEELVVGMAQAYGENGVSLSLPSLRVQVKTIPVLEMTSNIRRSNVTFALEAASELQRERIHKKSSEENLHYLIRQVFDRGWDLVKVYFMMGLPDRDGREIDDLIRALNDLGRIAEESGKRKQINVTVSLFVPKPFTTFQWEKQQTPEYFQEGLARIRAEVRSRRVHLRGPDPWMAYIEGMLSRSDHRAGEFILRAYESGARFCSWDDQFRKDIWSSVMEQMPDEYRTLWMDQKPGGTPVPWHDIIDGVSIEKLKSDFQRFEGVSEDNMNPPNRQALEESQFPPELLKPVEIPARKFQTKHVLAIDTARHDPMIYVSHLEIADVIRRACRRAQLPMTFSRGFNKHERFHFVDPPPLFMHSRSEMVYVELFDDIDLSEAYRELRRNLPQGLELNGIKLTDAVPSHRETVNSARHYRLDFEEANDAAQALELLRRAPDTFTYTKRERKKKKLKKGASPTKEVTRQLASVLTDLKAEERAIEFGLAAPAAGAISIADLMTVYLQLPVDVWNVRVRITKL